MYFVLLLILIGIGAVRLYLVYKHNARLTSLEARVRNVENSVIERALSAFNAARTAAKAEANKAATEVSKIEETAKKDIAAVETVIGTTLNHL